MYRSKLGTGNQLTGVDAEGAGGSYGIGEGMLCVKLVSPDVLQRTLAFSEAILTMALLDCILNTLELYIVVSLYGKD
ncbi:hypothetical protein Trydic_g5737 [Trypoxylus dichotomus]